MSNQIETGGDHHHAEAFHDTEEFVTFTIADQLFGLPVLTVQDVLSAHRITRIPLAPTEIAGSLGLTPRDADATAMSIVVEHNNDLYSLLVDSVGEVLALSPDDFERNPPTLDSRLRVYSNGIYRLNDQLLVVLDVTRLLDYGRENAA